MSDPVELALIGAGRMGRTHLEALAGSDTVRIRSVVDPSPDCRTAAESLSPAIQSYADVDEALTDTGVDGALIAAPSTLHRSLVERCARRGLPILCEKPCGTSTRDIDAAAQAAQAAGALLQIGYWRRFVPELTALREQLLEGRFGELLMVSCSQWDESPPGPGFRESSGGIAIDMASTSSTRSAGLPGGSQWRSPKSLQRSPPEAMSTVPR